MPQVALVVGQYVSAAIVGIGGGTFAAASVGLAAGTAAYYATNIFLLNKAIALTQKRRKSGETRGLETQLSDSTADARCIYGEVRISGVNMIPPVTSGLSGEYQHQILALCNHEIDSFQAYYFDQETLPTPGSITGASTDGEVTSGKYDGHAWVRGYTGTMTQTVDYILNNAFPSQWLTTARGRGTAYAALTYGWGRGKIYKGLPQATFKVRGAKVYDPRLDSTNGGSGTHRYTDSTTWAWSSNPALCWANFKMAAYGFGVDPATKINWATVATAADVCDALVDNQAGGTSARYTCNGMLVCSRENLLSNEQALVDAMMGHRRRGAGGKWEILAGAWRTPDWTIAKSDWLSIDSIQTVAAPDEGRVNGVHCFYVDPARNWQRVECYPRTNATYLSDDGGKTAEVEMEQPLCTDESEAQRKAEFLLRASRNGIVIVGSLPPRFQEMLPYDTCSLTFSELGWSSKTFRISAMTINMDGSVRIALTEEQDTDWTDLTASEYAAPSTWALPATNPTVPSQVTALTATTFPGAIDVLWAEPTVRPVGTLYRLMEASVNSYQVAVERWLGDATRKVLSKPNTQTYYYWVDALASNGSYSTFPGVSSGVPGFAGLVDTNNIAPGAVSWVTRVNCLSTQTHSAAGAVSGISVAELNINPSSITYDGFIDIYVRSDFGNARTGVIPPDNQYLQLLGKCGANSYYYIGSGSIIPQSYQTGDALANFNAYGSFPVTANNSVAAYLLWWWPSSGTHGFMHREDILQAEFRKR